MKNKHVRVKSLFLTFIIIVSTIGISACGSVKKSDENVITVFCQPSTETGVMTGWLADTIEEKFGVKLEFVNASDTNLMVQLSYGNLGDLIILNDADSFRDAYRSSLLLDWNEDGRLDELGSYMKEHYTEAFEKTSAMIDDAGIYGIGSEVALSDEGNSGFATQMDLRTDLYEQVGSPAVDSLEDYVQILTDMQKLEPQTESGTPVYGVSLFSEWDNELMYFATAIANLYGYEQMGTGYYNVNEGVWEDAMDEDGIYVRALRFYNELYRAGLLDPDSMTQTYEAAAVKYAQGAALLNPIGRLGGGLYNTEEHLADGRQMSAVVPADSRSLMYQSNPYGNDTIWCIGVTSMRADVCMEIINWLYSPQGYEATQENGMGWFNNTTVTDITGSDSNARVSSEAADEAEDEAYIEGIGATVVPGSTYTLGYMDGETNIAQSQVRQVIETYSWQAVYAADEAEFEALITEMITKANEYPYEKCISFYTQEALRRGQSSL